MLPYLILLKTSLFVYISPCRTPWIKREALALWGKADVDPMSCFNHQELSLITLWYEHHNISLSRGKHLQHLGQSLPQSKLTTEYIYICWIKDWYLAYWFHVIGFHFTKCYLFLSLLNTNVWPYMNVSNSILPWTWHTLSHGSSHFQSFQNL